MSDSEERRALRIWRYHEKMRDPEARKAHAERTAAFRKTVQWVPIQLRSSIKKRAIERGLAFDLDQHVKAFAARVIPMRCELSGVALVHGGEGRHKPNSISVDRIDSSKGYTFDNIRIIAFCLNAAFGAWGEREAIKIMRRYLDRLEIVGDA